MEDQHFERLVNCFGEVFTNLDRASIPNATHSNIAEWDSIAQVTLLSLIGEEFAIEIDFEDFEDATSFSAILELVRAKVGDGSASSQKAG
ncbi:MAG: acyl carrier protein [Paludibaculum sp.]